MSKPVILTGLRANSEFHLGNYLGAILPMVDMQKKHSGEYQINMFVPDLHSFTTPIDHGMLYQNTLDNLKVFVAAGLDIENPDTFIYRQSYIPAHSELMWILSCFTYFGELRRMTQFKEKAKQHKVEGHEVLDSVDTEEPASDLVQHLTDGLFNYPVLMAADILLYGAKYVPVGEDQRQHVEFTRDLAIRMNNKFGELFVPPEDNKQQAAFVGRSEPVRIRSLRNPDKKMSKSIEDPAGTLMLSDKPEEAVKKVMSATTDSVASIHLDWAKQPGISNLLQISALLQGLTLPEVAKEWEGKNSYGELKTKVAEQVRQFLTDIQAKLTQVSQDSILKKLEQDEEAMRKVANATLLKVQKAVGLRPA